MRKLLILLTVLFFTVSSFASHIVGGEMLYEYLGPGAIANTKRYRITLRLFRDQHCNAPCAAMPANVYIGIFNNDNRQQYPGQNRYFDVAKTFETDVLVGTTPPCVINPPDLDYHVAEYVFTEDLPANNNGYTATYQTCCRVNPLTNVFNSPTQGSGTGSTYSATIPGGNQLASGQNNSSPKFFIGVAPICQGKSFFLDFKAEEPDGVDSLVYSFCEAYDGGAATSAQNLNPAPPPYGQVPYINGYSATMPLGPGVTINSKTGLISGIAPPQGEYVICVCVNEYRNGKLVGTHRKDFIVNVEDCDFAGAQLKPTYSFCKSLTASFKNENSSPLNKTYFWDFGDGTSSTLKEPSHTYADTGTYNVKLVINRGESCSDSTLTQVQMYPFFTPDFSVDGFCVNKSTRFFDRTTTSSGAAVAWAWDFGDLNSVADVSDQQNPSYTYNQTGPKSVRLIATSSKGCSDTTFKTVDIFDRPPVGLSFKDTLICNGDRLQLSASGTGSFSWQPSGNINNANTATPTVFPSSTTKYVVTLDNDGCINTDTVQVRVINSVSLQAINDTTICAGDRIQLNATTNGLQYQWTPSADMNDATKLNPEVHPVSTTIYQIESRIGQCAATDNVTITVVPYPFADAGKDSIICFGNSAVLQGRMTGKSFTWSPTSSLAGANTLTPTATPNNTTAYVLAVLDDKGCPKPGLDTVIVRVLPPINAFAGNDTTAVVGQPLQLQASGGVGYQWSPAIYLNRTDIASPVGIYDGIEESIQYKVLISNEAGCSDSAFVSVRVFKTDPRIFVPTAFSPNGDGKNDIFRPIGAGISQIVYFRVFNRWGEMVFSTSELGKGWDGRLNGKRQGSGTYVWMVKGIDFTGKEFVAKGTVTLIR